ncbi:MAG: GlgB N-terminal domain-containing protein, partial [Tabrizicola sp.]
MAETTLDRGAAEAIAGGWHGDPFGVLGPHKGAKGWEIRAFVPGAERLWVLSGKSVAEAVPFPGLSGLFTHHMARKANYRFRAEGHGNTWEFDDPYRFGPVLGEMDEYLLGEGTHKRLWQVLGAHVITHEGVEGTHFAVWAPNAERVSVVG